MTMCIDPFDLSWIQPNSGVAILGKTFCGKSALMYKIMHDLSKHFNFGMAVSPTVSSRKKFESCIPLHFIDDPDMNALAEFLTTVKENFIKEDAEGKEHRHAFFIADDTAFDEKFMKCKSMTDMMMNGRNYNCFRMVILQYIKTIGPKLRSNLDFVFCFWASSKADRDAIYSNWFDLMDRKTFDMVFRKCTENYGALVVSVRRANTSRDWRDCVFWYRVDKDVAINGPGEFKMCDRDFFRISKKVLNTNVDKNMPSDMVRMIDIDGNIVT